MNRIIDPSKAKFWTQLLQRFAHSGLSVPKFCSQHNVAPHNFHYWAKRLKLERSAATTPASVQATANVCPPSAMVSIHFDGRLQVNVPADRTDILCLLVQQLASLSNVDHPARDATAATKFKQIVVRPAGRSHQS